MTRAPPKIDAVTRAASAWCHVMQVVGDVFERDFGDDLQHLRGRMAPSDMAPSEMIWAEQHQGGVRP